MTFFSPDQKLPFQFELDNGNGLVHLHVQHSLCRIEGISPFYFKALTGVILIIRQGTGSQWQQINAISVFQKVQIRIAGTDTDHIGDVYKRQPTTLTINLYHSKWSFHNGYEPFYTTTINYD